MDTVRDRRKKLPIFVKAALLLFCAIFPLNALSLIANRQFYKAEQKNTAITMEYTLETYANLLDNRIFNANSLLMSTNMTSTNGIRYFQQRDGWRFQYDRYQLYKEMLDRLSIANTPDMMFFYAEKLDDLLIVLNHAENHDERKAELYRLIEENDHASTRWTLGSILDEPHLIRFIYDKDTGVTYGAAISLTDTINQITAASSFETAVVRVGSEVPPARTAQTTYSTASKKSPLIISLTIDNRELSGSYSRGFVLLSVAFILYLSLIPILIWLFRKNISQPLTVLHQAHEQLKSGNEDYRITETADSVEFQSVFDSFNSMGENLKELREESVRKELYNQALQLESLQLQIRPHFLLNSFHMLHTLIQAGETKAAQNCILYLSNYFRYMFRNGMAPALFTNEFDLIREYLQMAKLYYPGGFTVSYIVDPVIDLMQVPALLLHSFIENIIQHALVKDTVVNIVFAGEYENGLVTFHISDNGRGLPQDVVDKINHFTEESQSDGKGIGILNSVKRLKRYYGDEASISVESGENFGTVFTICIPYDLEDEPA